MTSNDNDERSSAETSVEPSSVDDGLSVEEVVGRLDRLWSSNAVDSHSAFASLAGTRVGPYVVERMIGRGAFGIVYKARDPQLQRDVALKVPRPEVLLDDQKLKRFEAEASTTAKLDHPSIVPLFEAQLAGATPYLASAYCPGPNLQQWMDDSGPIDDGKEAARLMATLADAVQYAHEQGIIHRDLKPANVLLVPANGQLSDPPELGDYSPKLTDFGLARLAVDLGNTQSSLVIGTPMYMAPEQAECRLDEIGSETDTFGLGAILYHLLTGTPPFAADSYPAVLMRLREGNATPVRDIRPKVDRDLATICEKCLRPEACDRYKTAGELQVDLRHYLEGEPISASPMGLIRRLHRWSHRPERAAEAMLAVIIMSVIRLILSFAGTVLLIVLNEASLTAAELRNVVTLFFVTTPFDVCMILAAHWNARKMLSGRLCRLALLVCAGATVATFLTATGTLAAPMWYQRMPGARTLVYLLISLLFMSQAICWYLGDFARLATGGQSLIRRSIGRLALASPIAVFALFPLSKELLQPRHVPATGPSTSMHFDGIDDMIRIPDVGFSEDQPFTLEFWVRPDRPERAYLLAHSPVNFEMSASGEQLRVRVVLDINVDDSYFLEAQERIPVDQWSHITLTYDTQVPAIWLNGRRSGYDVFFYTGEPEEKLESAELEQPLRLKEIWSNAPTTIASHDYGYFPFEGRIGEVRLSKSVFYRGNFTPSRNLSVGPHTRFLFHLDDRLTEIDDVTGRYRGTVHREPQSEARSE